MLYLDLPHVDKRWFGLALLSESWKSTVWLVFKLDYFSHLEHMQESYVSFLKKRVQGVREKKSQLSPLPLSTQDLQGSQPVSTIECSHNTCNDAVKNTSFWCFQISQATKIVNSCLSCYHLARTWQPGSNQIENLLIIGWGAMEINQSL